MSCTSTACSRWRSRRSRYQSIRARKASSNSRMAATSRRCSSGGTRSRRAWTRATSGSSSAVPARASSGICQPAGGGLTGSPGSASVGGASSDGGLPTPAAAAAASAISRSAASEARSKRSSSRRRASSAEPGGGTGRSSDGLGIACSPERHLERPVLERGGGRLEGAQCGGQDDRPPLPVHADDQLEPDLLERDVALLRERKRQAQLGAVLGHVQLLGQ